LIAAFAASICKEDRARNETGAELLIEDSRQ
jgi:hypothetical protein